MFRRNMRTARLVSFNEMLSSANPRVPPTRRRRHHVLRPARDWYVRTATSEDQMQDWFTRLAEECERGTSLTRSHAAGLFDPEDDD